MCAFSFASTRRHTLCALTLLPALLALSAPSGRAGSLWESYQPSPPPAPASPAAPFAPPSPQSPFAPGAADGGSIFSGTDPETGDAVIRVGPRSPSSTQQQMSAPFYPQVAPGYSGSSTGFTSGRQQNRPWLPPSEYRPGSRPYPPEFGGVRPHDRPPWLRPGLPPGSTPGWQQNRPWRPPFGFRPGQPAPPSHWPDRRPLWR